MDTITKYFPGLSEKQCEQFAALDSLYRYWNERINVVSRKDIDNLYVKHVLHSLAIAAFLGEVKDGTAFLDLGTGGGFPGIPLAIFYPDCRFHLIDRIGKKIKVATEVARNIGLGNVTFQHGDIGECRTRFNYVVSRAVMPLNALTPLVTKNITPGNPLDNRYTDGIICLKGGDLEPESQGIRFPIIEYPVGEFFSEEFFETKKLVYLPVDR